MLENLPDDTNVKIAINIEYGGNAMPGGALIDVCRCTSYCVNESENAKREEPDFTPNCVILANAVLDNNGWKPAKMPSMVKIVLVDDESQVRTEEAIIKVDG